MSGLRIWFWSVRNWAKGYKFGPVQRFRCCDHTTPFHYRACGVGECVRCQAKAAATDLLANLTVCERSVTRVEKPRRSFIAGQLIRSYEWALRRKDPK